MKNCACIFLLLFFLMTLSGCSSRRSVAVIAGHATVESVSVVPSATRDVEHLSCNVRMRAAINGKSVAMNGKLRVKGNEGMQLSATPLGLMEVACLQFLPDSFMFIYKIDKVYSEAPYSAVPFLGSTGTGYCILESVILNRMFSPDGTPFVKVLPGMDIADEEGFVTVTTSREAPVVYKFYLDKSNGNLVRSEGTYTGGGKVVCSYSDFVDFEGKPFPQTVELLFNADGLPAILTLKMSNLNNDTFKFSPRRVSGSYGRLSIENVIESLSKMN